ncbi:hypothetical protein HXX76_008231 [Chlamydomonas incerta]|uniref:SRCR domain-containing protein n=1 Tax=Chlamydomonas incerta TaxID=51695 RepID=A0A835T131_CHLIN|nr:hypothetical protein HXX76_008231 [Chlamydomonas incerta]|eukprot:KAG2433878.1 hypothetical protein HXX76_008231 [Chlamydomonas incerta]
MGYIRAKRAYKFGAKGSAPIVLDDVNSQGNETRLVDCPHAPLGTSERCTQFHGGLQSAVGLECEGDVLASPPFPPSPPASPPRGSEDGLGTDDLLPPQPSSPPGASSADGAGATSIVWRGSTALRNAASGPGGAVYYLGPALPLPPEAPQPPPQFNDSIIITAGSLLRGCRSLLDGGAVWANTGGSSSSSLNVTLSLHLADRSHLDSNRAERLGGSVFLAPAPAAAAADMLAVSVTGGSAITRSRAGWDGGGVAANGTMRLLRLAQGGTIANNTADVSGGGVFVAAKLLAAELSGRAALSGNAATYGPGGGLAVGQPGPWQKSYSWEYLSEEQLPLQLPYLMCIERLAVAGGSRLDGNSSPQDRGGAVYCPTSLGVLELSGNSSMSGNTAGGFIGGGAVYVGHELTRFTVGAG